MRKARRIAAMILVMNIVAGIAELFGKWHLIIVLINAVVVLVLAVFELENGGEK